MEVRDAVAAAAGQEQDAEPLQKALAALKVKYRQLKEERARD